MKKVVLIGLSISLILVIAGLPVLLDITDPISKENPVNW